MPLQSGEWDVFRVVTVFLLIAILVGGLLAILLSNKYFSNILRLHLTRIEAHETEDREKFAAILGDISLIRADIGELRRLITQVGSGDT